MTTKRLVVLAVVLLGAVALAGGLYAADPQVVLKLSEIHPQGYPTELADEEFARLVNEKSDFSHEALSDYISKIAKVNKQTVEAVKAQAGTPENFQTFWTSFLNWHRPPKKAKTAAKTPPPLEAIPTQEAEELQPGDAVEGQGPTVEELLYDLEGKGWPLAKIMVKFGANWEVWSDEQKVKALADLLAAQEA